MSTIDRGTEVETSPLFDGQRLDRATFHELYEQCPDDARFELIGGVVYLVPNAGADHGYSDGSSGYWLAHYASFTPGVGMLHNASVFFEDYGEPQPDVMLIIKPEYGGQTRREGKFITRAPELAVEISDSSIAKDLGPKLADYERAGVLEYVVVAIPRHEVIWHDRQQGRLVRSAPDTDGILRSKSFPGLWLDPEALLASDYRRIRETVDRGVATPEHAAFVDRLALAKG